MILSKSNIAVGKQAATDLKDKAFLWVLSITLAFAGCEKKPEGRPVAERTPQPAAKQTPSAVDPQPQPKPVEATAAEPVDETKTYYVKELGESLSLKQINERIQAEELWPTNIYLEFPESQPAGTTVDGVEKPLSALKGIAKFVRPASPPWSRNLRDTVRWLKVVSPQALVAVLSKPDPELPSHFVYVLAGVERASGDVLWRFELPADYEFGQAGPDIQWFLSEPKLAISKMDFKKNIDPRQRAVWLPQVLAVNLETGKEAWRLAFPAEQEGIVIQKIEPKHLSVRGKTTAYIDATKGTLLAGGVVPPGADDAAKNVQENPEWLTNTSVTDAGVVYSGTGTFLLATRTTSQ